MAFLRFHSLPRSGKKCLLLFSFVLFLTLAWVWLRAPLQDFFARARKPPSKHPISGTPGTGDDLARNERQRTKRNVSFNGLVRINIEQFPLYDTKQSPEKVDEKSRRTGDVWENTRMSDVKPSIGLIIKSYPAKFNVKKIVKATATVLSNTTRQRFILSNDSRVGESKDIKNSVERNFNISHRKKYYSFPVTGQLNNFKNGRNPKDNVLVEGYLNVHTWFDICSASVDSLRNSLLFPIAANRRKYINTINAALSRTNSGQRLFGYLKPPTSGNFTFSIQSRDSVELWLSTDRNPGNLRVIVKTNPEGTLSGTNRETLKVSDQRISASVELRSGDFYYIEVLHKRSQTENGRLEISWKNSLTSVFSQIPSSSLIAVKDVAIKSGEYKYSDVLTKSYAHDDVMLNNSEDKSSSETVDVMGDDVMKDVMGDDVMKDVLQACRYQPSYLIRHKLVRFQGARNKSNTRFVKIFPPDSSNESLAIVKGKWYKENAFGNKMLDNRTAVDVSRTFMASLERKYPRKYTLGKILSIRATEDDRKGTRFFLNLKLHEGARNSTKYFARYVYKKRGETTLCFPENFRWNPRVMVHVVVPVKDLSTWLLALVKNIEEIIKLTNDQNINIVIVDYGSQDLNVERLLKESSIKHFRVVSLPQSRTFRRAEALQKAADAVDDPHGILFLCDLHLSMPRNLFALIRQHCIKGKMAFAPVVKRLRCGYYPSFPSGYWETLGFGLFAIYKSDFKRIGGMDIRTFKQWGGEDWELLDRVLMSGMEVERLKVPAFYHFYHKPLGSSNQRVDA